MLNKLRSAVSSALPGIPLSKDFDVHGQIASGGPGLVWKIFSAVKKTTKQEASVFVFEKKILEKYPKKDREIITEALKKGISQLTRLRHPKVLSVLHPLEESRETLAFATEPVFASLANVLGNHENISTPVPKDLEDFKLYEVEIKHGLLQITEGIGFLHKDAKIMHNNLCPENIIVNKTGTWKLAGFDCCIPNGNKQDQNPLYPFHEWDPDLPPLIQPHLDYLAPEYSLTMSCSESSDMFSIGVLIHAIYNNGKPLYECQTQLSLFRKFSEELRKFRSSLLGNVPEDLHQYVKLLLNTEPSVRPDPDQLAKIPFFEDVGSMTLQYMDNLFQQENLQKSQFFKGLPKIITKLPKRVNLQRIMPPLMKECANPDMIPFVLPNLLLMAEQATDQEYATTILPQLIPLFKIKEPIQVLLIFMQNMNLLLKKTPQGEIRNHVLPMIHQALEADSPQLQEICLKIVPTFADLVDFSALKNTILPRIKKICLATSTLSVRTNCLLCLGKLLEYMDKWTVLDDVLPLLPQIPTREPAVLMSMLGIYQITLTQSKLGITKDILATKVLPFLIPIAIDNNLNLSQFNAFMAIIKDMLGRLENEHRTKLEQLDQMKQEQKSIEITQLTGNPEQELVGDVGSRSTSMMDKFLSGFGISALSVSSKEEPRSSPVPSTHSDTSTADSSGEPAQVKKTLTLEEKQRLAQQQEQQRMYKAQKPLSVNPSKPSSGLNKPSNTAPGYSHSNTGNPSGKPVKDLTSTLLSSNMMQLDSKSASSGSINSVGSTGSGNYAPSQTTGWSPLSGGQGYSALNITSSSESNDSMKSQQMPSSLDNLLPSSSQSKRSLNEMRSTGGGSSMNTVMSMGQTSRVQPQGMMGNQGMMGMGFPQSQQRVNRGQGGFGIQQPSSMGYMQCGPQKQSVFPNQSMSDQTFPMVQPMASQNFNMGQYQPMINQNMPGGQSFSYQSNPLLGNSSSLQGNSASDDLKDIFG